MLFIFLSRSHKGHPLCKFCDERYLDNDELVRHLRKDHFFCHFCDSDGISNQFYGYVTFTMCMCAIDRENYIEKKKTIASCKDSIYFFTCMQKQV